MKVEAIRNALIEEAELLANDVLLEFELTTATWKHQPKFEKIVDVSGKGVEILVGTDDEIYGYVTNGAHIPAIPYKPGRILAFPASYTAKTVPGMLGSRPGGPSGDMVFARSTKAHDIKPRNFDKLITNEWKPKFHERLNDAMKRGVKESGYEYKG